MSAGLTFQIGKKGLTPTVIDSIALAFKNHKIIRISLLSASGRDREKTKEIAKEICDNLEIKTKYGYSSSIIGFKIMLRRHGDSTKPKRKPIDIAS